MIRPRLVLATIALAVFGVAAGAEAAELPALLLAQSGAINALRGPGLYLNLFKFVPVVLIYLAWVKTVDWVDDDTRDLQNIRFEMWNSLVFFTGVLGFLLVWLIPVYPIGLLLLLIAYLAPSLTYAYSRNQTVPDDRKVLTAYHFGEILNGVFRRRIFNVEKGTDYHGGPPIIFVGKTSTGKQEDDRVAKAEGSTQFIAAKELVFDAILRRATDIHLEPSPDQTSVRYRIDGIMHAAEPFDRPTGDAVVNIFKVLCALDIAERRKPQDGSFGAKFEGREIDFRVATSGSKAGEKLVMRILDNAASVGRLEEVGMRPKMVASIREIVNQPHGMFLCCGPTGSGKSTTLYACLREIDRFQKNIITVEDPVEYHIDNVTQIEINTKAGQSFAGQLRSILRQDPDVIMIGEIRDQETATISCQAATTGHMVFSTVHANDTVTALFRLLDLGVEPFMIANSVSAILGQRLVRLLCETCKEPYKPKAEFLKKANLPPEKVDVFYRPPKEPEQVCPTCGGTGYMGRTGIFELLVISDAMRDLIRENPSVKAIKDEARKNGMIYLTEDGLRQVIQGRTSIEELMRVVK
ncbi:GspE/PulE family protein [Tautonia plasticadhaerens]|uniref:Type II secretion system protein E n=1 Tax=Tautonia plasticadhaerens TaxID=2527974 RepID=A0A518H8R7_9BACT|nr:GspE/PulE family protein [Tautonia plasticadhaerens]QDV37242.1 Type II secretion system protein E [Tautonia plasticadhaerens]